ERTNRISSIQFDDSQVAIGLGHVIAGNDCLVIKLSSFFVALLVQEQRFFKRREQPRDSDLPAFRPKQTHLALQLRFDLLDGQTLCAHLAHAPEKRQRLKVISEVAGLADGRALNNARLGPAAYRALAQTEE